MRVLVADRDAAMLDVLYRAFAAHFDIDTATSRADCVALLREREFDVIIACEKLADGSGLHLLSHVTRNFPDSLRIFAARSSRLKLLKGKLGLFGLFRTLSYPIDARKLMSALTLARAGLEVEGPALNVRHVVLEDEWTDERQARDSGAHIAVQTDMPVTVTSVHRVTPGQARAPSERRASAQRRTPTHRMIEGQDRTAAQRMVETDEFAPAGRMPQRQQRASGQRMSDGQERTSSQRTNDGQDRTPSGRTKERPELAPRQRTNEQQDRAPRQRTNEQQDRAPSQRTKDRQGRGPSQPKGPARTAAKQRSATPPAQQASRDAAERSAPKPVRQPAVSQRVAFQRALARREAEAARAAQAAAHNAPTSIATAAENKRSRSQLGDATQASLASLARAATQRRPLYDPSLPEGASDRTTVVVGTGLGVAIGALFLTLKLLNGGDSIAQSPGAAVATKLVPSFSAQTPFSRATPAEDSAAGFTAPSNHGGAGGQTAFNSPQPAPNVPDPAIDMRPLEPKLAPATPQLNPGDPGYEPPPTPPNFEPALTDDPPTN